MLVMFDSLCCVGRSLGSSFGLGPVALWAVGWLSLVEFFVDALLVLALCTGRRGLASIEKWSDQATLGLLHLLLRLQLGSATSFGS